MEDSESVNIESSRNGVGVVIKVVGRMDAESAPDFEVACKSWVDQGIYQLVIDMGELAYVSSMGLRSFITVGQLAQQKGGNVYLCSMRGLVRQVFEITRLIGLFPVHNSVDSALATQ